LSNPLVAQVDAVLATLDVKRPTVAAHCRRVSAYAVQLARTYGVSDQTVETIRVGGLLHDVGKLMIPAAILSKPGRLTEREWHTLQSHPEHGFDLVRRLGFDDGVTDIVLYHHERLDSSGYPDGLTGDAIPWGVRVVSVMDAFDALTSPRTYRDALSVEAAWTVLARESVGRYCPWAVAGLLSIPRTLLAAIAHGETGMYRPEGNPGPDVVHEVTVPWTPSWDADPDLFPGW
jgi:putative nucleotidyltransferase with HDIG domain